MCVRTKYRTKDLVSIIIPTYNRGDLIGETLDSFFTQSYRPIELIIIDDGSTDDTAEVIRIYKENLPEGVSLIYSPNEGKGACAARNKGTSISSGEYIQYFDSDDIVCEEFLTKRVNILKQDNAIDIVACNYYFYNENISIKTGHKQLDNIPDTIQSHLFYSAFPTPVFLCRRSAIDKMGKWDENSLRLQDVRYFNRLYLHNLRILWLPDYLFIVREHANNLTSKMDRKHICSMVQVFYSICDEWQDDDRIKNVRYISAPLITSLLFNLLKSGEYKLFLTEFLKLLSKLPMPFIKSIPYHLRRINGTHHHYIIKKLKK